MLEEVKQRLSITGHDLDPTINGMIDDVVAFCLSAGVKYSQLVKPDVIGLVARGVAELWNYGAGDGKFSQVFHMRLNQLCIAAYSIDGDLLPQSKAVTITENGTTEINPDEGYILTGVTVDTAVSGKPEQAKTVTIRENGITEVTPDAGHVLTGVTVEASVPGKPEQVKEVSITENGTTQITPDEGKVLSGVSVSVDVAGGASVVTIPPVKLPLSIGETNFFGKVTDIDLGAIEWANTGISSIANLLRNLPNLKSVKWGDPLSYLADSVDMSYLFYYDSGLEYIDLTPFNAISISNAYNMFNGCTGLKNIAWGNVRVRAQNMGYMFYQCTGMNPIDTSFLDHEYAGTTSISSMFYQCSQLKALDLSNLNTVAITSTSYLFYSCRQLTNVVFENGCFSNTRLTTLELSGAPLSHDCAVDIFNKLATRTNSPSLKLSATTMGYLTENEIAIATGKGWVVS